MFLDGVVSQAITVEIQGQKDQKTALCIVQNGDSWETGLSLAPNERVYTRGSSSPTPHAATAVLAGFIAGFTVVECLHVAVVRIKEENGTSALPFTLNEAMSAANRVLHHIPIETPEASARVVRSGEFSARERKDGVWKCGGEEFADPLAAVDRVTSLEAERAVTAKYKLLYPRKEVAPARALPPPQVGPVVAHPSVIAARALTNPKDAEYFRPIAAHLNRHLPGAGVLSKKIDAEP